MAPRNAVYIMSVAAELAGVHPQTLRTYERKGLIRPARTPGGTRRYSQREIERVRLIQQLTQGEGVNLAGVLRILELTERVQELEDELERARAETEAAREEARRASEETRRRLTGDIVLYRPGQIERHFGPRRSR